MTTKAQTLTLLGLAAPLALAQAQTTQTTAAAPPAAAPSSIEQTIQDIKNPVSWLSWGGDFRWRNEYVNNAATLNSDNAIHEQDYFRFRGRVWLSLMPTNAITVNTRLAAEPREFFKPAYTGFAGHRSGMEWRYGIIDTLNVQVKKPFDLPATLTVGRQDIFLGDGWLVGDGTPIDGSFTYFLDAARLTYNLEEQHTTIDAIGIVQYARPDAWLPTLGPSTEADPAAYSLTDQNEKGAILWVANKSLPAANLDGYFIYKHDTRLDGNPPLRGTVGDNGDIYTLGGRVSGMLNDHWKYSAEGAYQFGWKEDKAILDDTGLSGTADRRDLGAFGVNSKLVYLFKDKLNDQVSFNYEFLSGDDKGTKTDEMFDILWGRYPRWTELYAPFSYGTETRAGQMNNLHRIGPGWTITPVNNLDFIVNYYALFADQDTPTRFAGGTVAGGESTSAFSGNSNFRGHYLQAILKYKFSQHLSGHLWSEFVFPGEYYANHETMSFLRAEMMLTF